MGDVISFPQQLRAAGRGQSEQAAAAEILFFTGVRYQRMAETAPVQSGERPRDGGMGAKRKRKRG